MGIIKEGQRSDEKVQGRAPALDGGLLAAAQAVQHYEIARYGTLKTWAAELGLNQGWSCWRRRSAKKRRPTKLLLKLAQSEVNQHEQAA
jgi:ferritin-like metal-binding protein YciE